MSTTKETIILDVVSPKTNLSGFDAAVGKMKQMEQLHAKLAALPPISVKFQVEGADSIASLGKELGALKASISSITSEIAAFSKRTKEVQSEVEASATTIAQQAKQAQASAQAMAAAAQAAQKKASADAAAGSATAKVNENLNRTGLLMERIVREGDQVISTTRKFQAGVGVTETVTGNVVRRETDKLAKMRSDLEAVSADFRGRRQDQFDGGFKRGSQQQIDLLRQEAAEREKILKLAREAGVEASSAYQAEARRVQQLKLSASQQQGQLRSSQNRSEQKFSDRLDRQLNASLADVAKQRESDEQQSQKFSDRLDRQLNASLADVAKRKDAEARDRVNANLAAQRGQVERQTNSLKKEAQSREQMVAVLLQQAAAYDKLTAAYAAAGQAGGAKQLSSMKESAKLNADAVKLERQLAAERQRTTDLSSSYQRQVNNFGGRQKTTRVDGPEGRQEVTRATRDTSAGMRETIEFTRRFDAAGKELTPTLRTLNEQLEQTGRSATAAGKSFFSNIATVTAWAAAVGVLYKSLALLEFGAQSVVKLEYEQTRLGVVFRQFTQDAGTQQEQLAQLNDQTLRMAILNGRSGDEAQEAAIKWARLGLSQQETLEALDVSLKAANVAEISTAEAAEQLSAIYAAYRLEVGQLRTVLNQLNTVSNIYNVTNKDLLGGLARSSAIAKQAGLGFSELVGIIGSGVGRTGRSGAEIGNAIKSVIVSLSNPALQDFLRHGFKIDVKNETGDLKSFSTILEELYVRFQELSNAERQELIQKVAGKQQASRLQAILDGYVQSQVLAIQAQRNLNSAEEENARIRQTAASQLESLATAFQRLSINIANAGRGDGFFSDVSLLGNFTEFIKLLTNLMNLLGDFPKVAAVAALTIGVLAVRLVRAGLAMQDGSTKGNLLTRTINALRASFLGLEAVLDQANGRMARSTAQMNANTVAAQRNAAAVSGAAAAQAGVGAGGGAAGAAGAAVGGGALARAGRIGVGFGRAVIGTLFSKEMLVVTAAIYGLELAFKGINKIVDYFSGGVDAAAQKLGVYNAKLERTRNEIEAFDKAGKLANTLSKSIGSTALRDVDAARQQISAFSSVAIPNSQDAGQRREAIKQELLALLYTDRANGYKNLGNRLDEIGRDINQEKVTFASREVEIQQNVNALREESVNRLNKEIAARKASGEDTSKQQEELGKLLSEIEAGRQRIIQGIQDTTDVATDEVESFSRYRERLAEDLKGQMSAVGDVFKSLPKVSGQAATEYAREIQTLQSKLKFLDEIEQASERSSAAEAAAAKDRAKIYADDLAKFAEDPRIKQRLEFEKILQGRVDGARRADDLARDRLSKAGPGGAPVFPDRTETLGREARLAQYQKEQLGAYYEKKKLADEEAASAEKTIAISKARNAELEKQVKLTRDAVALDLSAKESEAPFVAVRAAVEAGVGDAKRRLDEVAIGRNELQQTLNQLRVIGSLKLNEDNPDATEGSGLLGVLLRQRRQALRDASGVSDDGAPREPVPGARLLQARIEGALYETMRQANERVNGLLDRRSQLMAQITNQQLKQNEEASKALLLADREDQVRAALLKKYLGQTGGKIGPDSFQFFDRGTKEAASKFFPDAVPGLDTETKQLRLDLQQLNAKLGGLQQVAEQMKAFQDKIQPAVYDNSVRGGQIPQIPALPSINISLAEQGEKYLNVIKTAVLVRVDAALSNMQLQVDALVRATGGAAGAAQQSAVDSFNN